MSRDTRSPGVGGRRGSDTQTQPVVATQITRAAAKALEALGRSPNGAYDRELQGAAHVAAGRDDRLYESLLQALRTLRDEEPQQSGGSVQTAIEKELDRLRVRHKAEQALRAEIAGPPRPLEIATLAERLANPLPPIEWRLDGWQPQGTRGILTAAFKAGKTTLIGNLMRALVDGDDFLGLIEVAPLAGALGVLDFEMSGRMLDRWLADQNIVNTERIVLIPVRGNAGAFNIINPNIRTEWAGRLRYYGITYLILDPFRPWLDALGLDEHRDAGIALQALDQLMVEAEIEEGLIAHHHGHGAERARGDSRLRDWPDFEWKLVREDDDPASPRYISAYGRDVEVTESLVTYDEPTRRLTLVGGSRKGAGDRRAWDAIAEALAGGPLSGNQLELALTGQEHGRATVRKVRDKAVSEGRLTVTLGARNAKLYTLNPSSSPVRQTPGEVLLLNSSPPYIGRRTSGKVLGASSPEEQSGELNSSSPQKEEPLRSAKCAACGKLGNLVELHGERMHLDCAPRHWRSATTEEVTP